MSDKKIKPCAKPHIYRSCTYKDDAQEEAAMLRKQKYAHSIRVYERTVHAGGADMTLYVIVYSDLVNGGEHAWRPHAYISQLQACANCKATRPVPS